MLTIVMEILHNTLSAPKRAMDCGGCRADDHLSYTKPDSTYEYKSACSDYQTSMSAVGWTE